MAADNADFTDTNATVPPGLSLLQIDDLELAYGSRRLSDEAGSTQHEIWITLVAPGQVVTLDRPEHDRSVLLAYRGELEIEWEDSTVLHLLPGGLTWLNPPTPRALRNTSGRDAAFLTFSTRENRDDWAQT